MCKYFGKSGTAARQSAHKQIADTVIVTFSLGEIYLNRKPFSNIYLYGVNFTRRFTSRIFLGSQWIGWMVLGSSFLELAG